MRQKMDEADIRKNTETNALADFLRRVTNNSSSSSEQASKTLPFPSPPQKTRRATQTDVTSASVIISPLPQLISATYIKEFKYEPRNKLMMMLKMIKTMMTIS